MLFHITFHHYSFRMQYLSQQKADPSFSSSTFQTLMEKLKLSQMHDSYSRVLELLKYNFKAISLSVSPV